MWTAIASAIVGAIITAVGIFVRNYFITRSSEIQLESDNKAAKDRIDAAEKQAEADRLKRLKEIEDAANKINDGGSASDALDQLRKRFPGSSSSGTPGK